MLRLHQVALRIGKVDLLAKCQRKGGGSMAKDSHSTEVGPI